MKNLKITMALMLLTVAGLVNANTLYEDLVAEIDFVVDAEGTGDYTTVQAAIDAVPNNSTDRTVVFIKNGFYYEKVRISSSKINLVLIGEDMDSVIISYDDYAQSTTNDDESVRIDADDFLAMNITFENSYDKKDSQALAVSTFGDRQTFVHCRFNGWQDTYFSGGNERAYFKDCLIIGAVDFIFGPSTVVFDSCQIHNVRDGGYITAASTPEQNAFGYVFRNCRVTNDPGIDQVWFGRPWRPYAHTVYFESYLSECINPRGWNNWGDEANEETARYAEYKCYGPGSDLSSRVDWGRQLTDTEAQEYTLENIYAASNNASVSTDWLPTVEEDELFTIVKEHTTPFLDPSMLNGKLTGLELDGAPVEGFHPDSTRLVIDFPAGETEVPELTALTASGNTIVEIEYPEQVSDFVTINVSAPYMAEASVYEVYLSVDGSYHSANLAGITVDGNDIPNFDPEETSYTVGVPEGSTFRIPIEAVPEANGTRIYIKKPVTLPGTFEIFVTAADGETTKTYYVEAVFGVLSAPEDQLKDQIRLKVKNPFLNNLKGHLNVAAPGNYKLVVYNASGQKMMEHTFLNVSTEGTDFILPAESMGRGLYFYRIVGSDSQINGKLIK